MADKRSFYDILGVPRDASDDQIRAAHRRLARELHPDVNKAPDAAAKFAAVQEAYDVLSDPEKRRLYDRVGHERFAQGAAAAGGWPGGSGGRGPGAGTYTWSNIAGEGGPFDQDDIGSIFEEFFGGAGPATAGRGRRAGRRQIRGEDIQQELQIPFAEALAGSSRTLRLARAEGADQTLEVKVPKGVADGAKLRLRGKGAPGRNGGAAGDLILLIRVLPDPVFTRDGASGLDLTADLPVSIIEATLGAKVPVRTPGGVFEVGVPAGSASGTRLRLRGRGVETDDGRQGDFYAVLKIVPPGPRTGVTLSEADASALRDMAPRLGSPSGDARA